MSPSPSSTGRVVAHAGMVVLLAAAALAGQVPARFGLGDSRERVRQIQGSPTLIERLPSLGVERWHWGTSAVSFDPATGQVIGWDDGPRILRVALRAEHRGRDSVLTLGMALGDLARIAGTPWAVRRSSSRDRLDLHFGRNVVRVDLGSRRISGWHRRDGTLRVAALDDAAAHAAFGAKPPAASQVATTAPPPSDVALRVRVTGLTDRDGDGRLAPREFGDVAVQLYNAGPASTPPLRVTVAMAPGLARLAGTSDTLHLGPLASGDSALLQLPVYATGQAIDPELAVVVWAGSIPVRSAFRVLTAPAATPATALSAPPVDAAPIGAVVNPDALALVVGIERYQRLPPARYARRDATLMRRYLTVTFGVPSDGLHLIERLDEAASGSELRRLLGAQGWIARRVTPSTDLYLYFAGHGAPGSRLAPYLLPADADASYVDDTGLPLLETLERLARLPARSITVMLDACFTGLTRGGGTLVPGTRAAAVSLEHPALLRPGMAVLLASRDAEVAGDLPSAAHGAFTYHLARGLQGAADADSSGAVQVGELGRYVEGAVQRTSASLDREQRPLLITRDTTRVLVRLRPSGRS